MPLWRLMPIDPDDRSWEASTYCGPAVVRARNEAVARATAAETFDAKTRFSPGTGIKPPPWRRPDLVTAEVIEDPVYEAEGAAEVLFPPEA